MQKIEFFFDFLSPFSYFAWLNHTKSISQRDDIEMVYKPVLMGKLFSHFKFPGPGEITVKRNYELKKCFRYAHKHNISFTPPSTFPFNPLAIIRMATKSASGEDQKKIIDFIFKLVWGQGKVLEDPDEIKKYFEQEKLNTDIIDKSFEREAKTELKSNIKDAISKNIFGVPTFSIVDEYFWGNDSFDDLNNYLAGNDNYNKDLYNSLIN